MVMLQIHIFIKGLQLLLLGCVAGRAKMTGSGGHGILDIDLTGMAGHKMDMEQHNR